jgi:hypothetical protein
MMMMMMMMMMMTTTTNDDDDRWRRPQRWCRYNDDEDNDHEKDIGETDLLKQVECM